MALDDADFKGLDTQTVKGRAILALKDEVGGFQGAAQMGQGAGVTNDVGFSVVDGALTTLDFSDGGNGVEVYDDLGFIDLSVDGVNFTIPNVTPAIQRVRAFLYGTWASTAGAGFRFLSVRKNGQGTSADPTLPEIRWIPITAGGVPTPAFLASGPIPVVAGDQISFRISQNSGGDIFFFQMFGGVEVVL